MAAHSGNQHLVPPQGHRQQQSPAGPQYYQNDRSKPRAFSIGSEKSKKSQKSHKSSSSQKEYETSADKAAPRLNSKADPLVAMYEAEPSMVAAMASETNTVSLRSFQHRDLYGNIISDPDRSNPTRSRWERPLDTIRGFEAAINGSHNRRSSFGNREQDAASWNRRTSVSASQQQARFPQDSYYGNSRPGSYRDPYTAPSTRRNSGFFDGQGVRPPRREYEQNVYPLPNKDRSYETVTSAAGSGMTDPAGYQTDPTSSDNSSIRRQSPGKRHPQEPINDYGIGFSNPQSNFGFQNSAQYPAQHQPYQHQQYQQQYSQYSQDQSFHPLPQPPATGYGSEAPPAVAPAPPSKNNMLKRQPTGEEKRKSWLSRRFGGKN